MVSVRREGNEALGMARILRRRAPSTMRARSLARPRMERAEEGGGLRIAQLGRDIGHATACLLQAREGEVAAQRRLDRPEAGAFVAQTAVEGARRESQCA